MTVKAKKADVDMNNLAEKDLEIIALKEEIIILKQPASDASINDVNRLKFVCQKQRKKSDEQIQARIKLEETLSRTILERQILVQKVCLYQ